MSGLAAPADQPHPFREHLLGAIRYMAANTARSLQTEIGPSELGTPCLRELAYRLVGAERVNDPEPWFAVVGTAVHQWLSFALDVYQELELGLTGDNRRWLIEQRVEVGHDRFGLSGSTDVYDRQLCEVIDYKVVGATSLKKYVKHGPGPTYRVQAHTYGKGWRQRGLPVRAVTIVFLPRSGFLSQTHIHSEPFDEAVADRALERAAVVRDLLRTGVAAHLLPGGGGGRDCYWCPFYAPDRPLSATCCPGVDS